MKTDNKRSKNGSSPVSDEYSSRFLSLGLTPNYWLWEVDAHGIFTYCSPTVFKILGYLSEEILGKTMFDIMVPEEKDKLMTLFGQIVNNREPIIRLENSIIHKDGRVIYIETNGVPYYNSAGDLMGYRGIDREITRLKAAEKKLKDEHLQLITIIHTIPDMIWLKDPDGNFVNCNPRFEQLVGAREVDIIGKTDYDFLSKELADVIRTKDNEALAANKPSVNLEWVTFKDDGHQELLETIKTPMYNSEGKLTGILGIARDITKHVQTEKALRESESRLEQAMDMAKLGMWEFDFVRNCFILDDRFYSLFGTSVKEQGAFISREDFYKKFIHPDDRNTTRDMVQKAMISGDPSLSIEHRAICFDGEVRYIMARFVFQKDEKGNTKMEYGVNQDITTMKKAELELRELNATKDKFFSILAHDLRGPLSSFVGATEILFEDVLTMEKAEVKDIINSMKKSATNIYSLLENLLEWSRLMRNQLDFTPEKFNLKNKIEACTGILSENAVKKKIEIEINVPDDIEVIADNHMFDGIIRNLVSNAIKFTPVGGKVSVTADYKSDHSIEVKISDSGIGMTPELKNKLFLLSEKTNRPGTEGEPSSGLGLLLCKEFIEKHGGELRVESEVGRGSTFSFTIPQLDITVR